MSTSSSPLASIGKFTVTLLISGGSVAMRGWVLVKLWVWFLTPLGAPSITFWHAMGLATIVGWLTLDAKGHLAVTRDDEREWSEKKAEEAGIGLLVPLFVLFAGWMYHSFM